MTHASDIAIIGGGIVGLATALSLSDRYPAARLVILDKEATIAAHQTGHNSGVIHSGIYYKPGSLKARLCVEGARLMKAFCTEHGIHWEPCGKIIVATDEGELGRLQNVYERGQSVDNIKSILSHGPSSPEGLPLAQMPTDLPEWRHHTLFFRDPEDNVVEIYAEY